MRGALYFSSMLIALGATTPAWAVYKCTAADGRATFQEVPCAQGGERLDVRPASGPAPRPQADAAGAPAAAAIGPRLTEAQRINAATAQSQRQRRSREIEETLIPELRHQCDTEVAQLQYRSQFANNNLAGATWKVALAREMEAIASRCDTKQRALQTERDRLLRECAALGGCR